MELQERFFKHVEAMVQCRALTLKAQEAFEASKTGEAKRLLKKAESYLKVAQSLEP